MKVTIFKFGGPCYFQGILSRVPCIGEMIDLENGERLTVCMVYTKTYNDSYSVMVQSGF